tara:strand:- start:440 stop:1018 length:579 start_codon:yes stop_codon:yes gene_type:complete
MMIVPYQTNQKNLILEPLSCILKLILFQFEKEGTKVSVSNNAILFNEPSVTQGLMRSVYGDCREDLHNLYHPLIKATEWYPIQKYPLFYSECKKGFELLNQVYDDNTTIHHTISHYISILDETNKQSLPDTNPIIDQLKDIWIEDEIKAIEELLKLILNDKNKDIYRKSLNDIVSAKEKIVNQYIQKVSTSY